MRSPPRRAPSPLAPPLHASLPCCHRGSYRLKSSELWHLPRATRDGISPLLEISTLARRTLLAFRLWSSAGESKCCDCWPGPPSSMHRCGERHTIWPAGCALQLRTHSIPPPLFACSCNRAGSYVVSLMGRIMCLPPCFCLHLLLVPQLSCEAWQGDGGTKLQSLHAQPLLSNLILLSAAPPATAPENGVGSPHPQEEAGTLLSTATGAPCKRR